jgi:dihydrofolate reductase
MNMGKVGTGFSMSLDGFIAGPNDDVSRLFAWMMGGDTEVTLSRGDRDINLKVPAKSAATFKEMYDMTGAVVSGRRLFDVAGAWGGKHPMNVPVFVVTHSVPQEWAKKEGSPFTFVTDGIESAIEQAKQVAGDKNVAVAAANIVQQCLKMGLIEEIAIDLVPVLLGDGIRLFDHLGATPIELESTKVVEATGVIHMTYRVVK